MIESFFNSISNLNSWIDLKSNSFKFVDNQKTTLFALPIIGAFGLLTYKYYHATRKIKKLKQQKQINQKNKKIKNIPCTYQSLIHLELKKSLYNALTQALDDSRKQNFDIKWCTTLCEALEKEINSDDEEIKNRSLKKFTKNYENPDSGYSHLLLADPNIAQRLDWLIPSFFSDNEFKTKILQDLLISYIKSRHLGISA